MTIGRSTRHCRTLVTTGDRRVAGLYEPTLTGLVAGSATVLDDGRLARWLDRPGLACLGRLGRPEVVGFAELVDLARVLPDGEIGIAFVDLFARIELHHAADVIVFDEGRRTQLAAPVRDVAAFGTLLPGTLRRRTTRDVGGPCRLDLPGWTDDATYVPASMRAITFAEFVQCP